MSQPGLRASSYRFGRFLLEPERRTLSADGQPVPLSSRGFDLLQLLIEHRSRVVGKDEILSAVWHGTIVEENNLAVQISALRRALGEGGGPSSIVTVPGQGYRFVAEVFEHTPPPHAVDPPPLPAFAVPQRARSPWGIWRRRAAIVIATTALPVLALIAWRIARPTFGSVAPRLSLAVLPFRMLGPQTGQDYLADAITDDLTTDLSHLPNSVVIARESADAYKGRVVTPRSIGQALNVRYLLDGSLSPEGPTVHINAHLIDAATAAQLWSSSFDVVRTDLGAARTDIVRHLASALNFTLVQIEGARSLHERPDNPDAVDLYLRARSLLDRGDTLANLAAAQALLERAIAISPEFSDAAAELALVLLRKIGDFDDPDEWRDHARAETMIDRAQAAAPQNPRAIAARGMLAWEDQHCDQASPSFRLALSLDPNDVQAQDGLAHCARELGRMQEMIDTLRDILRIDPAAPGTAPRQNLIGLGYLMLARPHEALDWLERAYAAAQGARPTSLSWQEWNRLYLIAATWQSGDQARAKTLYAEYSRLWPHRSAWQLDAYTTRAFAALPTHAALLAAWQAAGLPPHADETADFNIAPPPGPGTGGDVDPTPLALPGARRIDTPSLHALLATAAPPLVLDVGRGASVIPGAILVWPQDDWRDPDRMLAAAAARAGSALRPIVVMGDGPFGWTSYNAARHLVATATNPVLWYRGGEEAWAASGYPAHDQRAQ